MPTKEKFRRDLQEKYKADRYMVFRPSPEDDTRILVSSIDPDGNSEIIGNIYIDNTGEETIYHGITKEGNEVFHSTDDFNSMEAQFDMYAKLLITEREIKDLNNPTLQNNLTLNNLNQMKNSNQNQSHGKKVNQLIFVEYQHPTQDGHLVTVTDSYRNPLGKIHRDYNEQTKKYEFSAYDYAGKPIGPKTEKLWELKKVFTDNSKQLLEDAHQRRIESKQNAKDATGDNVQPAKQNDDREQELHDFRAGKSGKTSPGLER